MKIGRRSLSRQFVIYCHFILGEIDWHPGQNSSAWATNLWQACTVLLCSRNSCTSLQYIKQSYEAFLPEQSQNSQLFQ
jgi:hypothetical protein